jgi:hypothetical protein
MAEGLEVKPEGKPLVAGTPEVGWQPAPDQSPYPMTIKPIAGGAVILIAGILGLISSVILVLASRAQAHIIQPTSLAPERIAGLPSFS